MTDKEIKEFTYFAENYCCIKDKNTNTNKNIKLNKNQIQFLKTL